MVVCYRAFMLKHFLFLFLILFALAAHAGRFLPQNAQVGQINGHNYPEVKIGGEIYRLAPGARIYDTSNRIIVPTSLPQSAKVFYQLDPGGLLIQMWLPTPEEEAGMGR
ncbi:MAG: hypothetical protein CO125_09640 [Hydrogenophilales bacterium CG_4_9_14_3_um_filter_59_35]|nr:MAG: hypothetical protein CO125_09640 [Hydrogenophilales bacterium CG_4_9_14_3_um_filter_59_35]